MLTFRSNYFYLTVLLFITEVLIALFVRDRFIRPYFGDVLVVILMNCFIRSFFKLKVIPVAIGVLCFAFLIEFLQYLRLVERLGLEQSPIISTVLGTSFAWNDLLAYAAGFVIIVVSENLFGNESKSGKNSNNQ